MEHAQNMPFGRGLTPAQAEVLTPANRVGRFPVVAAPERGEPLWAAVRWPGTPIELCVMVLGGGLFAARAGRRAGPQHRRRRRWRL